MQHDAHTHPRADIRGPGTEITQAWMERVPQISFQVIVESADLLPRGLQIEAAMHHLQAKVVLLVHHDAEGFARFDQGAARALGIGQLAADKLPLNKELAVDVW